MYYDVQYLLTAFMLIDTNVHWKMEMHFIIKT